MRITSAAKTESPEPVIQRLDQLERRIARLELNGASDGPRPTTTVPAAPRTAYRAVTTAQFDAARIGSVFGSVAKAVLGLAGAYLLRAAAESGWLPHSAAIVAGFAYALTWIIAAGIVSNREKATSTIYALCSAVMLVGLVWENAAHSALLPPPLAALLILVYLCSGQLMGWVRDRGDVAVVSVASSVALSLVLFVTTHSLIPFNITLLCAAAVCELAASRGKWSGQRWMAALSADFALLITVWVSRSGTVPDGYAPFGQWSILACELAPVFIYLASIGYRTLAIQKVGSAFDIGQTFCAIGILTLGQGFMAPLGRQRLLAGVSCFIFAKASYAASILMSRKRAERNSLAYGIFGLVLQITAILIVVPPFARVFALCILGIGTAWFGRRERYASLQWHAPIYLSVAALVSGLIDLSSQSLAPLLVPRADHLVPMVVTTAATAVACMLAGSGSVRFASLLSGALLLWSVLGLGAIAIKGTIGALSIATSLRIGLFCVAAIGSVRWGTRGDRREWIWLGHLLMANGAWRILVEDLPSGTPVALALSLLFYGGALLIIARTLKRKNEPR